MAILMSSDICAPATLHAHGRQMSARLLQAPATWTFYNGPRHKAAPGSCRPLKLPGRAGDCSSLQELSSHCVRQTPHPLVPPSFAGSINRCSAVSSRSKWQDAIITWTLLNTSEDYTNADYARIIWSNMQCQIVYLPAITLAVATSLLCYTGRGSSDQDIITTDERFDPGLLIMHFPRAEVYGANAHRHLMVLKWMQAQQPPCPAAYTSRMFTAAAKEGNMELLAFLRSQDCPWGSSTADAAFESGHFEALFWLWSQVPSCPWQGPGRFIPILRPILPGMTTGLIMDDMDEQKRYKVMTMVARQAAWAAGESLIKAEFLDKLLIACLKALKPQDDLEAELVAASGRVLPMEWLLTNGTLWRGHSLTCTQLSAAAAAAGQIPMLLFLSQSRLASEAPAWNKHALTSAARNGQLETLKWLRTQSPPCPWSFRCCIEAASNGHLDVLRWLSAHAPEESWTEACCVQAARSGHTDVLKYLQDKVPRCFWTTSICCEAAAHSHVVTLRWLLGQGYPWSLAEALRFPDMVAAVGSMPHLKRMHIMEEDLAPMLEAAAEFGQLELMASLLERFPSFVPPPGVCQQAADYNQLEIVQHLMALIPRASFPDHLEDASHRCLLVLAQCGCPMQASHPHLVAELVQSWYTFMGLVRWAGKQAAPPLQWRGSRCGQRAQQAWQSGLLRLFCSDNFANLALRIAADAFLSPDAAMQLV